MKFQNNQSNWSWGKEARTQRSHDYGQRGQLHICTTWWRLCRKPSIHFWCKPDSEQGGSFLGQAWLVWYFYLRLSLLFNAFLMKHSSCFNRDVMLSGQPLKTLAWVRKWPLCELAWPLVCVLQNRNCTPITSVLLQWANVRPTFNFLPSYHQIPYRQRPLKLS